MGAGTPYTFSKLEGLDLPGPRNSDSIRPRSHGELSGLDVMSGRDIILTGFGQTDGTSLQHALKTLGGVMAPQQSEQPLWLQIPNLPLLCSMARPRQNAGAYNIANGLNLINKILSFHATDPRLYAAAQTATVGLGTPLGGLRFPVTFPASFGGGTVAGVITANNAGNFESRPILIITGPCTNPMVANATTGWSLSFSNPFQTSFTVLAGDTLVVDLDLGSVQYFSAGVGVGANRKAWLVAGSVWPDLVAGINGLAPGNNTIQFTSTDASTVAGTLTCQWASAYMF